MHNPPNTVRALDVDERRRQRPITARGRAGQGPPPAAFIDLVSLQYEPAPRFPLSPWTAATRVLLTLGFAAICLWYLQAQKDVVVVDGDAVRRITTFAPTVRSALARSEVAIGPEDRVIPDRDARLVRDQRIEVLRPKEVVLVLNGERRVERVTGRTVAEVLKERSIASRGALIQPAASTRVRAGDQITVAQSVQATLVHDGKTRSVTTNVLTARDLLHQLGVTLSPHDRVEPGLDAYPAAGSTITVVRVNQAVEKVQSKIPFKKVTERTAKLELGVRKVKTKGREGTKTSSYRVTYEDGRVKSRTFVDSKVTRQPVAEVILVGSHRPTVTKPTRSQTGKASWYSQPGLMAAHRTLPFGTAVRVTNLANGKQVTVTIRDRGPFVEGRIIDLSGTAFEQLSPHSRGVLNVKIEW
ncbi:MAG: septal ring lytic transglycosylase RlpA family protein [Actinomycetota bacterium]|nr:septal ring lytic transglycosylase RlpA family protein [Actinomycetota bacterium]